MVLSRARPVETCAGSARAVGTARADDGGGGCRGVARFGRCHPGALGDAGLTDLRHIAFAEDDHVSAAPAAILHGMRFALGRDR